MWNAIRSTGDIVDLTTRYQAEQAWNLQGFEWQQQYALPDYYWGKHEGTRLVYIPDACATFFALEKVHKIRKKRLAEIGSNANMNRERKS